ncbi:PEPxxWA-CTERM sorting domain-containing protein [Polymorphobacter fuscus]|uniref:PEPxxWA-CTERM sorting domain-containing protein n=1 Tax=Sandarakinorhabdus fusca TaxID=1439888 RepID=A0A7C9GU30_9SPHN|nr:PEPxxWA-CTERM sorting domain-containing protein [Polymorphobacter fuscus]KAB7648920.1 hypothetical protein F9290_04455 [Polymorphobacter fuscus]MQT16509.1 PEPxxWA-CTERM sorting domain-containing protein [Polymorphobacter fuscus]NJC07201.1 hypothetical protein [Polymorphobacter fuscus]
MSKIKLIMAAAVAAASLSSTAAHAVIETFATFSSPTSAANVRWVNNGVGKTSSVTNTSTGTGGYFYTIGSATGTVPASTIVAFNFLQPVLATVSPISADFFMDITVTNTPASTMGGFSIQIVPTGSFSFTSRQAVTVGNVTYAAGSNLLTGTFSAGSIFGASTSGSFSGNSDTGVLTYTSDFLDFDATAARDFSMSMTSITPSIFRTTGRALRTFTGVAGGSFSSDPAPIVNAVPEPQVWGMLVVGFGLVGVQVRRRARNGSVVA